MTNPQQPLWLYLDSEYQEGKSVYMWAPSAKSAIFCQKVPQNCRFVVPRASFGKILQIQDQIPKALNVLC